MRELSPESRAVDATVKQTEGKLTMSQRSQFRLTVSNPRNKPLSGIETHATVQISSHGSEVKIELDAEALDHLIDELHAIQSGNAFDD